MASFLDRALLKVAQNKRTKFDLSCRHITTQEFMQAQPIYYRHLVPNQTLEIDVKAQLRMTAMLTPTFGAAKLHLRSFWIPYSVIWQPWYDFITDSPHNFPNSVVAIPSSVPYVKNSTLVRYLMLLSQEFPTRPESFDFCVVGISTEKFYRLSPRGRQVYKMLRSLGYSLSTDTAALTDEYNKRLSALPLMAYLRVYLDWYYPAQFVGDAIYTRLCGIFTDLSHADATELVYDDFVRIMSALENFVCYDSDYFTSAFDNPTGPSNFGASAVSIEDANMAASGAGRECLGSVLSDPDPSLSSQSGVRPNTPLLSSWGFDTEQGSIGGFTQFALQALQQLTSYMKRHQLAGNRAVDRFLARFGVKPSDDILLRSRFIGSYDVDLDVRSIESTADTSGANLGAYAGQGQFRGSAPHWTVEAGSDYGMFVVISSIVPRIGYYQGTDPQLTRLSRLDQFTPEFDGLGTEAIAKSELMTRFFDGSSPFDEHGPNLYNEVFGFKPRYADYKCGRDWLTGDFLLSSLNQAGDTSESWHLFRDMRPFLNSEDGDGALIHSREFVMGYDGEQYNRIFYNTDNSADHFISNYIFNVKSSAPMRSLYDSMDFDHEDGKDIRLETNGVRVN